MKLNYKLLGQYIRQIDVRNDSGSEVNLLGVSTQKKFIDSIANTIGTNFKKYKVIKKNQFAYVPDTSRRGDKIGIAMLLDRDEAIVSQAYTVFEIIDENLLNPEYLMMWFSRVEFDRYARYMSHGSVREIFSWEDMCNVKLPVPSIEKQREIVKDYNTILNRIQLNENMIEKLEDLLQSLYRQWFVDFEYPDESGNSYKSSGGAMTYCHQLDNKIPTGWKFGIFEDLELDISDGNYSSKYPKNEEFKSSGVPFIRGVDFNNKFIDPNNLIFITEEKHLSLTKGHTKKDDILITTRGASIGKYAYITDRFINANINSQLVRVNGNGKIPSVFLGCLFNDNFFKEMLNAQITGSAQPQLSIANLMKINIIIPDNNVLQEFSRRYTIILEMIKIKSDEKFVLQDFSKILLTNLSSVGE
jgi:type I restriction enzyme, S subunit